MKISDTLCEFDSGLKADLKHDFAFINKLQSGYFTLQFIPITQRGLAFDQKSAVWEKYAFLGAFMQLHALGIL